MRCLYLFVTLLCLTSCSIYDEVIPKNTIVSKPTKIYTSEDAKINIAILAPLNKQKEEIGQFLINSAELALIDSNNSNITIFPLNSELIDSNPNMLLAQLKQNDIKLIIGPVYTAETKKLKDVIKDQDITILSLSNDSTIAKDNIITLGISPDSQANILTNYAIGQGIKHFYLLLPATKYGKLIDRAVQNIVSTKDDATHTTTWYSTENAELITNQLIDSLKNVDLTDKAIFMPQAGPNILLLNKALENSGLKIQLIGSGAWDHPDILKLKAFDGAILLEDSLHNKQFYYSFNKYFKMKPTKLDVIIYNTTIMISNMNKRNLFIDKQSIIYNNKNFDENLPVTFTSNGISLYKMSVLEVHNGKFQTMENFQ